MKPPDQPRRLSHHRLDKQHKFAHILKNNPPPPPLMNYKHQEQLKSIRSAAVILPKKKRKEKKMHLSSCLCCDPLHVTAVHVQTVRVLRRHRCIHVHLVDCMHIGCTTTNMDYTTRPGAVTASVHVIKKNGGEKKKSEAR